MKALEKDRARRYETAAAFAKDVRRYLDGDAVEAGPPSARYRLGKFARKNRAGLATAGAFTVLLVAATAVSATLAVRASRARGEATKALGDSETARKDAEARRAEVGRLSAGLALDRGLDLAKSGRADRGLHWMAEALRYAGVDAAIEHAARTNIAAWSREVPRTIRSAPGRPGVIRCAALSPDGRIFAGGWDDLVTLWDLDTLRPIGEPGPHGGMPVRTVAFRPDGSLLATGGFDGAVRLWDVATGRPIGEQLRPPGRVEEVQVAFAPGNKVLVSMHDRRLWFWDLATRRPVVGPVVCGDAVVSYAFSPDGNILVTGEMNGTVQRRDGTTGRPIGPGLRPGDPWRIAFCPDGRQFAVGLGFGDTPMDHEDRPSGVQIFESSTGKPVGPLIRHRVGVTSPSVQPRWLTATGRRL
jgi:WD40 repeat protein